MHGQNKLFRNKLPLVGHGRHICAKNKSSICGLRMICSLCHTLQTGSDVFVSFRVSETDTEARWLKSWLEAKKVQTFVSSVDIELASIWRREIAKHLETCKLVVILGSSTYGEVGSSTQGTLEELVIAKEHEKRLFVFKMCERYTISAGMELSGMQSIRWFPGTPLSESGMQGLLKAIKSAGLHAHT